MYVYRKYKHVSRETYNVMKTVNLIYLNQSISF